MIKPLWAACVAAVMFVLAGCSGASSDIEATTASPSAKTYNVVPQVAGAWEAKVGKDGTAACMEGYEPFNVPFGREVQYYDYHVIAERDADARRVTVTFLDGTPVFPSGYVNGSTPFDLDTYPVYGPVVFVFHEPNFVEDGGEIASVTFCELSGL